MAREYKSDFDILEVENEKKKIIPDNDYLPFVPVRQTLMEMNPGEITVWPNSKLNSVRVLSHRIGKELGRVYRCFNNRKEKTVDVCRFS